MSDPGYLPTTRQMALALGNSLDRYVTSVAVRRSSMMLRLPLLAKEFARRVPPAQIERQTESRGVGIDIARAACARMRLNEAQYRLRWHQLRSIDRYVAASLAGGSVVVTQYGGALATLAKARQIGSYSLLDYPIARLEVYRKILDEEADLRPDFRDTIVSRRSLVPRPREMERIAQEVQLADLVIVGSRFAARTFAGTKDAGAIAIVPYGVDTAAFKPREVDDGEPSSGPLRILFAGALTQRKGIGYLLDAAMQLDPRRFPLTLAGPIVGTGAGLARYRGRFRHLGGLRPMDMPLVYTEHDVLVLPSLVEGSALVVLEAMASGVPVVVTPNSGADAVHDGVGGLTTPIRDVGALVRALETLDRDRALLRRLGQEARQRAATFDWEHFRERFRAAVRRSIEHAAWS